MSRRPSSNPVALSDFGDVLNPDQAMEPILARPVRGALLEWLTELWAADELQEVGLLPRRRALFFGAPGTGGNGGAKVCHGSGVMVALRAA